MASRTVGDVIDKALRRLRSRYAPVIGTTTTTVSTSQAYVYLDTASHPHVGPGDLLQIGRELLYVTQVDTVSDPVFCIRGYADTPLEDPIAAGAQVEVNPRYFREDAMEALLSTVRSWKDLFWVDTRQTSFTADSVASISIPGAAEDYTKVVGYRYQTDDGVWVSRNERISFIDKIPDAARVGNVFLQIESGFFDGPLTDGQAIFVHLARPFRTTQLNEDTAYESVLKVPESYEDIMVFGIMWRLIAPEEGPNQDTDAWKQSRQPEDVPPGALVQTSAVFKQFHDERVSQEEYALAKRWGWANG